MCCMRRGTTYLACLPPAAVPSAGALITVGYTAASVCDVDADTACMIYPDGDGGWVVGPSYDVR